MTPPMNSATQESVDAFYWSHGRCCAGCDHWRRLNASVGECRRSAPVSGEQRLGMLDMEQISFFPPAGHVMTKREHACGEFADTFDWSSLPLTYRHRVGAP